MNQIMDKYISDQFKKLKVVKGGIYLPKIKFVFIGNKTNWLSLTFKQYEKIKAILTK